MGGQNLTSKHVLQNGLAKGETQYGTFMMLGSGWTARLVAAVGFDVSTALGGTRPSPVRSRQFILVDCEHGNIGDNDMHESVAGVAASGASPIVRIRNADIGLIKRALDTGAQ